MPVGPIVRCVFIAFVSHFIREDFLGEMGHSYRMNAHDFDRIKLLDCIIDWAIQKPQKKKNKTTTTKKKREIDLHCYTNVLMFNIIIVFIVVYPSTLILRCTGIHNKWCVCVCVFVQICTYSVCSWIYKYVLFFHIYLNSAQCVPFGIVQMQ